MAGDWARAGPWSLAGALSSPCTDGKLQWEEEATVNRLQSNEVPASLGCPPWGRGGEGVREFPAMSLAHGNGLQR